jgi:nucleoside-diphosphate-sugar epimerase
VNVFLAGATGAVGRRLSLLLLADGHAVTGTTRSRAKEAQLRSDGVTPVVADVFDSQALRDAVVRAKPEIVIHELTDLAGLLEPNRRDQVLARNARLRIEGTANLVAAAIAAGARRLIAQSIAFAYAEGPEPHAETDPLASGESGAGAVTARGVRALEQAVLSASGLDGLVLRYGRLYGPGTWSPAAASGRPALHVDAAARAAQLAATRGAIGVYNIAEDDGAVSIAKARRELGFDPAFRLPTPPVN